MKSVFTALKALCALPINFSTSQPLAHTDRSGVHRHRLFFKFFRSATFVEKNYSFGRCMCRGEGGEEELGLECEDWGTSLCGCVLTHCLSWMTQSISFSPLAPVQHHEPSQTIHLAIKCCCIPVWLSGVHLKPDPISKRSKASWLLRLSGCS